MSGPRLSVIPAGALADIASGALKAMDLRVLCALGTFTNEAGWCRVRQDTLAAAAGGVARETVNRSLTRLAGRGWVEQHAGRHRAAASSYRVVLDPKTPPPGEDEASGDAGAAVTGDGVTVSSHRDVTAGVTHGVTAVVTPKNESLNESPLPPQGAARPSGPPADGSRTDRASTPSPKPAGRRTRRKRRSDPEPPPPPPPMRLSDLGELTGATGAVVRAALNGWQKPESVKPWLDRFRVLMLTDPGLHGEHGRWRIVLDEAENEERFRSVFTGAMIALGIGKIIYRPTTAERVIGRGQGQWHRTDAWGVVLKPEILAALNGTAATASPTPAEGHPA